MFRLSEGICEEFKNILSDEIIEGSISKNLSSGIVKMNGRNELSLNEKLKKKSITTVCRSWRILPGLKS